jgi:hypothetical protein
MKKLLFLLLIPLLFGCEMYMEPTNPQLNLNGEWKIVDIIDTYSENLQIVNDDFYAVSPFVVKSINNGQWIIQNDTTDIHPCYFYKKGYVWEFDYNQLILKNDRGEKNGIYYVGFFNNVYNSNYFKLDDKITGVEMGGVWQFATNFTYGSFPSNVLYITVPEIEFSIDGSERSYDRLINQNITITLMR